MQKAWMIHFLVIIGWWFKWSKSDFPKESVFSSSVKPFSAGAAGNHVVAAGINPAPCAVDRARTGKNRWLNLGRKQVSGNSQNSWLTSPNWHISAFVLRDVTKFKIGKAGFIVQNTFAINKLYKQHFLLLGFIPLGFKETSSTLK